MFVRLTLALTLAGCYSPELADCTVVCSTDLECGGGQLCTGGRCVREGLSCAGAAGVDAVPATAPDAGSDPDPSNPDAPAQPDPDGPAPEPDAPPPTTTLRVKIKDHGQVTSSGLAPCSMECHYTVDVGEPITLVAIPDANRVFDKWEEACTGQPTICTITPGAGVETRVTAKFEKP